MESVEEALESIRVAISEQSMSAGRRLAKQARDRFPESGDIWALSALTELWSGDLAGARESLSRAVELTGGVIVPAIRCEFATYFNDTEAGLKFAEIARAIDPDHWTYLRQSFTYRKAGQVEQCERMVNRYLELLPNDPAAISGKATNLMVAGKSDAIEAYLESTPESYRTTTGYYRMKGSLAVQRREIAKAEEYFRLATAACPENGLAWALLASVLVNTSRLAEAEQAANYALEINPQTPVALTTLAKVCQARGDREKAKEFSRRASEAVPGANKQESFRAATDAARRGNASKQIQILKQTPPDEMPMQRLMRLRALVDALREMGRIEELRLAVEELRREDASSIELTKGEASLFAHDGDVKGALACLDVGLEKFPTALDLMAKKVLLYSMLMRKDEAQACADAMLNVPVESGSMAALAIMDLESAGFPTQAKALLVRAEREAPADALRFVRLGLQAQEGTPAAAMAALGALPAKTRWKIAFRVLGAIFLIVPKFILALLRRRK